MQYAGSLTGEAGVLERNYKIGATLTSGQVVVAMANAARTGVLGDPDSANDYDRAIGIALEARTYTTTQGSGADSADRSARVTYSPLQLVRGRISGGTAADTAFVDGLDGNLLVNTTASAGGTLVTDADVGTSEYVGGYLLALTGANAGQVRVINAHTDNTSTAVSVPFDSAIAVNDTFLRTFAPHQGQTGNAELTTNFEQFNGRTGAGVDLPDTGDALIWEVEFDIDNQGTAAAPLAYAIFSFEEHVGNSRV